MSVGVIKHCAKNNLGEREVIVLTVPGYRPDSRAIKVGVRTVMSRPAMNMCIPLPAMLSSLLHSLGGLA